MTAQPPARFPRPLLGLAAMMAVLLVMVSAGLHPRFEHQHESAANQLALLAGRDITLDGQPAYFPQFQNRVLFPVLMWSAMQAGVGARPAFVIMRLATGFAACLGFLIVAWQESRDETRTAAAGLLLALGVVLTFSQGWETPSDFLDVLIFAVGTWLAIRRDFFWLGALVLLASSNRESSLFLGLLWIGAGDLRRWRTWMTGAVLIGVAAIAVIALRYAVGGSRALGGPDTPLLVSLGLLMDFFRHPTPAGWPVLGVVFIGLPCFGAWLCRPVGPVGRQLLLSSVVITGVSVLFGRMDELRVFLPALSSALLAPLAGLSLDSPPQSRA